jgi:catechol 2,3-dioxygenase-like lactoylglutathione lyase family enzyme
VSRVQLALNVDDVDAAVAFYTSLFGTGPAKRRPGYANFAIDDPALKLVLIENPGHGGSLNHLGVEVDSTDVVVAETRRLGEAGLATEVEDGTVCCYALQDKVWVDGPLGHRWEIYTVLADADADAELELRTQDDRVSDGQTSGCCATPADQADKADEADQAGSQAPCCAS